jgi:type I restriction enzyme M protein
VDQKFDYLITNPPFGVKWESLQKSKKTEYEQGTGRFELGLPLW